MKTDASIPNKLNIIQGSDYIKPSRWYRFIKFLLEEGSY